MRVCVHACDLSFKEIYFKDNAITATHLEIPLKGRKEGNVLFNDALNTFYLRLYDVRHMVKDHSDSEKGNPLPPHGLLFLISSKGYFICAIQKDRIAHTTAFVTPVVEHSPLKETCVMHE